MRSYNDWAGFIWELEKILKANELKIPPNSAFEASALALLEMDFGHNGQASHDTFTDHREKWRRALSLADLAEKLVMVQGHPDFNKLGPHLRLLAKDADLSQFSFTAKENQENNKVFELYVATMCLHLLTACEVDDPEQSNGTNPDVLGTFNGKRWGIACKAMHSRNPKTLVERVEEGIRQIECSSADRGLVILNMKNTIDHDALWPARRVRGEYYYLTFPSIERARAPIVAQFEKLHADLVEIFGSNVAMFRHLFLGKKASPHILLVYSTVTGFDWDEGPVFTILKTMEGLYGPQDAETELLIEKLNNCLHNVPELPPVPAKELK